VPLSTQLGHFIGSLDGDEIGEIAVVARLDFPRSGSGGGTSRGKGVFVFYPRLDLSIADVVEISGRRSGDATGIRTHINSAYLGHFAMYVAGGTDLDGIREPEMILGGP